MKNPVPSFPGVVKRCLGGAVVALALLPPGIAPGAINTVASQSELNTAISRAAPGDVIVLQDGEWIDATIRLNRSGVEGKPIVVKAENAGQVVLTGASSLNFAGDWLQVEGLRFEKLRSDRVFIIFEDDADHCRLTESVLLDSHNSPRNWIHMQKGVSNRIDHCRFSGMNQPGMQIQIETEPHRPNHHRIESNFFGHRARGNGNGFETIRIGYSHQQTNVSGTRIMGNLFYKCDGENEIISVKSTGNFILGNTFLENRGELTLRHGDRTRVEGNWFLGNNVPGSGGVRIIGSGHVVVNNYFSDLQTYAILIRNGVVTTDPKSYTQVRNALVAFNTIVNCARSIVVGSGNGTLIPAGSTIANNIVYHPSAALIQYAKVPIDFTYEGNVMFGSSLGIPSPGGILFQDPKLVRHPDGIYRPAADSPARNAALGNHPVLTDISGNPREGARDAGAQLLSSDLRMSGPLSEKQAGPLW